MKRILVATIFGVLVFGATALVSSRPTIMKATTIVRADEGAPCSLAGAAGNWSLTGTGTFIGIGPRVAVGRITLHSDGHLVDGVATASTNGVVSSETFSGTYTVNNDCSGTVNATILSPLGTIEVAFSTSFDENMHEIRGVITSAVLNGNPLQTVIALEARKQ